MKKNRSLNDLKSKGGVLDKNTMKNVLGGRRYLTANYNKAMSKYRRLKANDDCENVTIHQTGDGRYCIEWLHDD